MRLFYLAKHGWCDKSSQQHASWQDGQLVTFSEVHCMTELNNGKPRRVKNCRVMPFRYVSCFSPEHPAELLIAGTHV